jgi:hypothetical protein
MNLLDKIVDAYYAVRFKVEDLIDTVKYRAEDLKYSVEEALQKKTKKKAKSKKKKK